MEFNHVIKDYRIEKGLSVRETAKYVGVSSSYISNLESGRRTNPSYHVIKKLSELFDLDYLSLLKLAGYNSTDDKDEFERVELNKSLQAHLFNYCNLMNVSYEELKGLMNLSQEEFDKIKNMDLSKEVALTYMEIIKEMYKQEHDFSKEKYKPVTFSGFKINDVTFTKEVKDALGTGKIDVHIPVGKVQKFNHLDILLETDIDHFWKGKRLSEKEKKKINDLLDILIEDSDSNN